MFSYIHNKNKKFVSHRGTESTEMFNKLCALCDSVRDCIGLWAEPTLDRHAYFTRLFSRRSTRLFGHKIVCLSNVELRPLNRKNDLASLREKDSVVISQ